MAIDSVTHFVEELRESGILEPSWLEEVSRELGPRSQGVVTLARDLVKRGWLTPFQANLILEGHGRQLMFGPYRLLDQLGKGGMGEVFKAWHCRLGRYTALKIIRKEKLANPGTVERFLRESQAAAQLAHPHVVLIYDANQIGNVHYLAMEFVEGIDLSTLVKEAGPLPVEVACEYIRQAALGLQHAHEHGLVHRDIKPSNLMLARGRKPESDARTNDGTAFLIPSPTPSIPLVKILDFGLARFTSEDDSEPSPLTGPGQMMGTQGYVAPEQAEDARSADIRADIFSLGCSLFYLLTGSSPRAGVAPAEELKARLMGKEQALAAVLAKLTAYSPDDRYWTPGEAAADLEPYCSPLRPDAQEPPRALNGSAVERLDTVPQFARRDRPTPTSATPPEAVSGVAQKRKPYWNRRWLLLVVGWLVVVAVLLLFLTRDLWKDKDNRDPPTPPRIEVPEEELIGPPRIIAEEPREFLNSIGMKLVRIEPGTFMMGSPANEVGHNLLEFPQHKVQITRAYFMAIHEVTQEQFQRIMKHNPSFFSSKRDGKDKVGDKVTDHFPVENLTWDEAQRFCVLLSELPEEKKAGRRYRLPTEAEWEYACRAGTVSPFHLGDSLSSDRASVNGKRPYGDADPGETRHHPSPVGTFTTNANAFGLYDMHGNVWEWCADYYAPYEKGLQVDPKGPRDAKDRICRGGAFFFAPVDCRSAVRTFRDPSTRDSQIGFRVVCDLAPPEGPAR